MKETLKKKKKECRCRCQKWRLIVANGELLRKSKNLVQTILYYKINLRIKNDDS